MRTLVLPAGFVVAFLFCATASAQETMTWKFDSYALGNTATGNAYTADKVMMSDPIKLANGTYRMYYGASLMPAVNGATTGIKSATSPDGTTWSVESGVRLLGDADGDSGADGIAANEAVVSGPRVVQLGNGSYRMYYQASSQGAPGTAPDFRVKSATSADGDTWTREGTRIDIDYSNPNPAAFSLAGHCYVIRFSDTDYVILLSGNYRKASSAISDLVIGTSSDGLTFSNFSVLYAEGHDPFVVKLADGSGYRLFYGNLTTRQRTALSTDGKTWPAVGSTSETILQKNDGTEVTEGSTEAPGDRSGIEISGSIRLFMNWGNPSADIAMLKYQAPATSSTTTDTAASSGGGGGGGGGCVASTGNDGGDATIPALLLILAAATLSRRLRRT